MTNERWKAKNWQQRIGYVGAFYLYRIRKYRGKALIRCRGIAVLDPLALALMNWGYSLRIAPCWRLVRALYLTASRTDPEAQRWHESSR